MNKILVLNASTPNHPEDDGPGLIFIQLNKSILERLKARILAFQNQQKTDSQLAYHEHNDTLLSAAFEVETNNRIQELLEKTTNENAPLLLIRNDRLSPEETQELSVRVDVVTTATNEDSVFWQGYTHHSNTTWESEVLTLDQINELLEGAA